MLCLPFYTNYLRPETETLLFSIMSNFIKIIVYFFQVRKYVSIL